VSCHIENDPKEGVIVITGISAAGEELPLTIIGRGKTAKCLAGFQLPVEVWSEISACGWTTSDVMCCYLNQLRKETFPERPLAVILDTDTTHRTEAIRNKAKDLEIELVFIPLAPDARIGCNRSTGAYFV
jgi:hypothetical protein